MEWKWNNVIGSRGRRAVAVLVSSAGTPTRFDGKSVPGVVAVTGTTHEKAGKWSNTTYRCLLPVGVKPVSWRQDFESGLTWWQDSWQEGLSWLAEQAGQAVDMASFEAMVQEGWPETATRWNENAAAIAALVPASTSLIVTRHQPLVDWLAAHGVVGRVLDHVSAEDVTGQDVYGVLPMRLAAEANSITEVDLPGLTREERVKFTGGDFSTEDMDRWGATLQRYFVRKS